MSDEEVQPHVEPLGLEALAIAHAIGNPHAFMATSAQLAEKRRELGKSQAALAASQADLTRAEQDRAEAVEQRGELAALYESATAETGRVARERDEARHDLAHAEFRLTTERTRRDHWREQHDLARAELASARQEIAQLRGDLTTRDIALDEMRADLYQARIETGHQRALLDQVIADRAGLRARLADNPKESTE